MLFSVITIAQKGFNMQFTLQPGTSFISGNWMVPGFMAYNDHYKAPKKITLGFVGGFNGGYNFTKNIGLGLGLLYSHQRQSYGNYTYSVTNKTYSRKIRLSYLKIPFKFNFVTNPKKNIAIIFFAGVYYGVLAGYKDVVTINHNNGNYDTYITSGNTIESIPINKNNSNTGITYLTKKIYRNDFGITVGTGIQKKISSNLFLLVSLNYEKGLNDIRNLSSQYLDSHTPYYFEYDVNTEIERKNSMLGVIIGLKKIF
ncbi:MAG: hypothetical protein A2X08_01020 [Bacteroidetes bacterium GWA2_32_17]|nr:MAG: hypothetical protein A2X08_01020 [Bacteroidetes bacterium GWA2_32_17]